MAAHDFNASSVKSQCLPAWCAQRDDSRLGLGLPAFLSTDGFTRSLWAGLRLFDTWCMRGVVTRSRPCHPILAACVLVHLAGSCREHRTVVSSTLRGRCLPDALRVRGGSAFAGGDEDLAGLSFERQMRRMQVAKDKMLAALKRGDRAAARKLAQELASLKSKADKRLRKLSTAAQADTPGSKPPAEQVARCVMYIDLIKQAEQQAVQQREALRAETQAKVEAARAGKVGAGQDAFGQLYADGEAHGLGKCRNSSCVVCSEVHEEAEIDEGLPGDGILQPLDGPLVLHYVKRAVPGQAESGAGNASAHLLVGVRTPRVPIALHAAGKVEGAWEAQNRSARGLLVRLNETVWMTVEDRETLTLLADARGASRRRAAELAPLLPRAGVREREKRSAREEYERHVDEEYRLQQAEDMVWDGEARNLNEAFAILQARESSRDRWYSVRGPPNGLHLTAQDFAWETPEGLAHAHAHAPEIQLCAAACFGNITAVRGLLAAGASPRYHLPQFRRWTPLHFAAAGGWPEVVDTLVAAGAVVNASDERGQHALFAAAMAGGQELAQIPALVAAQLPAAVPWVRPLSSRFTHVPTKGGNWETEGSLAVARRLVRHGVHLWRRDDAGMSADQVAALNGREETRDYLRRLMHKDGGARQGRYAAEAAEEQAAVEAGFGAVAPIVGEHPTYHQWMAAEYQRDNNLLDGDEIDLLVSPLQVPLIAAKQAEDMREEQEAARRQGAARESLWQDNPWGPVFGADLAAAATETEGGEGGEGGWDVDLHDRVVKRLIAEEEAGRLRIGQDGGLEDCGMHVPELPAEVEKQLRQAVEDLLES